MQVGEKLKLIRVRKRMTLQQLSKRAGVSMSLLSQIERGRSAPTITTLQKVATGIDTPLSNLFSDNETAVPASSTEKPASNTRGISLVRGTYRKKLVMPWGAYYEMLCPDLRHKIEFIYLHYPPGSKAQEFYHHEGEECGLVLEGRFKGTIGDQEVILEAGDSICYDSSIPHRWENIGESEVTAIWAITPPSF